MFSPLTPMVTPCCCCRELCQAAKLPCLSFPISKGGGGDDGDPPNLHHCQHWHPPKSLWGRQCFPVLALWGISLTGFIESSETHKKIHLHPQFPFFLCQYSLIKLCKLNQLNFCNTRARASNHSVQLIWHVRHRKCLEQL